MRGYRTIVSFFMGFMICLWDAAGNSEVRFLGLLTRSLAVGRQAFRCSPRAAQRLHRSTPATPIVLIATTQYSQETPPSVRLMPSETSAARAAGPWSWVT